MAAGSISSSLAAPSFFSGLPFLDVTITTAIPHLIRPTPAGHPEKAPLIRVTGSGLSGVIDGSVWFASVIDAFNLYLGADGFFSPILGQGNESKTGVGGYWEQVPRSFRLPDGTTGELT
jgi:hypothetical protein